MKTLICCVVLTITVTVTPLGLRMSSYIEEVSIRETMAAEHTTITKEYMDVSADAAQNAILMLTDAEREELNISQIQREIREKHFLLSTLSVRNNEEVLRSVHTAIAGLHVSIVHLAAEQTNEKRQFLTLFIGQMTVFIRSPILHAFITFQRKENR